MTQNFKILLEKANKVVLIGILAAFLKKLSRYKLLFLIDFHVAVG